MTLPLLQLVLDEFPGVDHSTTLIIGCQHILGTTVDLFEACFARGLKPKNLFLLGKCYSTNQETFARFSEFGVNISEDSFLFDSQRPFDEYYGEAVANFFQSALAVTDLAQFSHIIILDDGGYLITLANKLLPATSNVIAIEQTTAGYEKIKSLDLLFPVINVARSQAKLEIESTFIAESVITKIEAALLKFSVPNPRVLIVGAGAIGQAIKQMLSAKYSVAMGDSLPERCYFAGEYRQCLQDFDLIIGATGSPIISSADWSSLKPGVILVSASSSDREFSATEFRYLTPNIIDCHQDLEVKNLRLLNCGFPINFNDGGVDCVQPLKIQLTRALLLAAIFSALKSSLSPGLVELEANIQSCLISAL